METTSIPHGNLKKKQTIQTKYRHDLENNSQDRKLSLHLQQFTELQRNEHSHLFGLSLAFQLLAKHGLPREEAASRVAVARSPAGAGEVAVPAITGAISYLSC